MILSNDKVEYIAFFVYEDQCLGSPAHQHK